MRKSGLEDMKVRVKHSETPSPIRQARDILRSRSERAFDSRAAV